MRSSSLVFGCLLLVLISGCDSGKSEIVYVDLASIKLLEMQSAPDFKFDAKGPLEFDVTTLEQPELDRRVIADSTLAQTEAVQKLIQQNREKAYQSIYERLRSIYRNQAEATMGELEDQFAAERKEALLQASQAFRGIFAEYADERAPRVLRLALLTGSQIPKKVSEPTSPTKYEQKIYEEKLELNEEIKKIEEEFLVKKRRLFSSAQATLNEELQALAAKAEELRLEADAQAEQEANQQVQENQDVFFSRLRASSQLDLPAEPSKSVSIEPGVKQLDVGEVEIPEAVVDKDTRRTLLEQQLKIWAETKGYRLSSVAGRGRDATEEFKEWRKKYELGPSAN